MKESSTDPKARCPHFGSCGGCEFQDIAYPEQLARKSSALSALFDFCWPHPIPVEASPVVWHYRNRDRLAENTTTSRPRKDSSVKPCSGSNPRAAGLVPPKFGNATSGRRALLRCWAAYRHGSAAGYRHYDTRSGSDFSAYSLCATRNNRPCMVVLVTARATWTPPVSSIVSKRLSIDGIQHAVFQPGSDRRRR